MAEMRMLQWRISFIPLDAASFVYRVYNNNDNIEIRVYYIILLLLFIIHIYVFLYESIIIFEQICLFFGRYRVAGAETGAVALLHHRLEFQFRATNI